MAYVSAERLSFPLNASFNYWVRLMLENFSREMDGPLFMNADGRAKRGALNKQKSDDISSERQ